MPQLSSGAVEARPVGSIEGMPTSGTFMVKPMLTGERIALLEVDMKQGVFSQMHSHAHESLLYVVSGCMKTIIAGKAFVIGGGEACLRPKDVAHSVEALADTLFIEIKSPVPALTAILGLPDRAE